MSKPKLTLSAAKWDFYRRFDTPEEAEKFIRYSGALRNVFIRKEMEAFFEGLRQCNYPPVYTVGDHTCTVKYWADLINEKKSDDAWRGTWIGSKGVG